MAEIIGIHLGSIGTKVGHSFWQIMKAEQTIINKRNKQQPFFNKIFFQQTQKQQQKPRAIMVDFDSRTEQYFCKQKINYKKNSFLTVFQQMDSLYRPPQKIQGLQKIQDLLRKQSESCDSLGGVLITCAPFQASGSSLQAAFLTTLKDFYYNTIIQDIVILPQITTDTLSISPVQNYNTIMSNSFRQTYADLIYTFDIVSTIDNIEKTSKNEQKKQKISYQYIFNKMGIYLNQYTAAYRYPGILNTGQRKRAMNLKPFPRLPYVWMQLSQMKCKDYVKSSLKTENSLYNNNQPLNNQQIYTISCSVRDPFTCQTEIWKAITNQFTPTAMIQHSEWFSCNLANVNFMNYKSVINRNSYNKAQQMKSQLIQSFESACTSFNGKKSINWLINYNGQFEKLKKRKAFMHYYIQKYGFVEAEFHQATDEINNISMSYGQYKNIAQAQDWMYDYGA